MTFKNTIPFKFTDAKELEAWVAKRSDCPILKKQVLSCLAQLRMRAARKLGYSACVTISQCATLLILKAVLEPLPNHKNQNSKTIEVALHGIELYRPWHLLFRERLRFIPLEYLTESTSAPFAPVEALQAR